MTVTIGIAYHDCPDEVERAVASVLAQTYRDLVCVVIGDGAEPPLKVRDDRLVVYTLSANHGAYFCEELVLEATPHAWYGPVAADDWIEPEHVDSLMVLGGTVNVPERIRIHLLDGTTLDQRSDLWEVGVFSTARLRELGGYDPAERIEQDQLLMKLLRRTGRTHTSPEITYHQVKRAGSLTMTPSTGLTSRYRRERRMFNRAVLHTAATFKFNTDRIREYRRSLVPPQIRADLDDHVERLRGLL